ncbi:MAG TPA: amino acid ABC transporter permease [bacterium]|nr:amino acid ABC transporter permease [bacterium]
MRFDSSIIVSHWPIFARGLGVTILFCVASSLGGLLLAVPVALGRLSGKVWLRAPAGIFVEAIRDTPFLVQAFIIFFVLPGLGMPISSTTAGILALSLYGGAYFAESIRGAILSVPKGQVDAARALGMSYLLAMRRVVFPQMMAYLIPPLTNQLIGLIKDSSVLSIITVPELTMATQNVLGTTFAPVEAFSMVALLYWLLTSTVAALMGRLERQTATYRAARQMAAFLVAADR